MLIAIWIGVALVVVVLVLAGYGASLPRGHVAACAVRLSATPDAVWAVVADDPGNATWAPGVKRVERLADRDGRPVWKLVTKNGDFPLLVETEDPPRRRVTRILDEGLPFGGTWTWEIVPDGAGSRVTVTEDGFIRNLLFRALARIAGNHKTIEAFLAALAKRVGDEGARVERIR